MIAIISTNMDQSTSDVIDWLLFYQKDFIQINETDEIRGCNVNVDNKNVSVILNINGKELNLSEIDSIWFRRGHLNHSFPFSINSDICFLSDIANYLNRESVSLLDFIISIISPTKRLGDYYHRNSNKLLSLNTAKKVGLDIPPTHVGTCKKEIIKFYEQYDNCISKDIQDTLYCEFENNIYYTMTSRFSASNLKQIEEFFFPSLLQEEIEKKYELRIFYLKGEFFSMAIFSQQDNQTAIDYRNYNETRPNRMVPYTLPQTIKQKLILFMDKMMLDSGSIDMIVTPDNQYYFLEVNPVGQYDIFNLCNIFPDRVIAQYLLRKYYEH